MVSLSKLSKPVWPCLLDVARFGSFVRSSVTKSETASAKNDMRSDFGGADDERARERYVVLLVEKQNVEKRIEIRVMKP